MAPEVFFELGISILMGYATGQLMRLALPPRLEAGAVLQGSGIWRIFGGLPQETRISSDIQESYD